MHTENIIQVRELAMPDVKQEDQDIFYNPNVVIE